MSGLVTPPDVISQIIGGFLFLGTMEFLVLIDSVKQGYLTPSGRCKEGGKGAFVAQLVEQLSSK